MYIYSIAQRRYGTIDGGRWWRVGAWGSWQANEFGIGKFKINFSSSPAHPSATSNALSPPLLTTWFTPKYPVYIQNISIPFGTHPHIRLNLSAKVSPIPTPNPHPIPPTQQQQIMYLKKIPLFLLIWCDWALFLCSVCNSIWFRIGALSTESIKWKKEE